MRRAKTFFKRTDRSALNINAAVPGIEHKFVEVNGVRSVRTQLGMP